MADASDLRSDGENRAGSTPVTPTITVYGPYLRKDGRAHVILYNFTNSIRITKSYPRFLMEQKLGRELLPKETVDHIDGDKTNNSIDNLQILSRKENASKAFKDSGRNAIFKEYECYQCKKIIVRHVNRTEAAISAGRRSPCCSRKCAGLSDK